MNPAPPASPQVDSKKYLKGLRDYLKGKSSDVYCNCTLVVVIESIHLLLSHKPAHFLK